MPNPDFPSATSRKAWRRRALGLVALLAAASACAETIDWYTADSGGGSSSGGGYSVTGTAGQGDAGASPAGGNSFQVVGGFWAGVQTAPPGGNGLFSDSFE